MRPRKIKPYKALIHGVGGLLVGQLGERRSGHREAQVVVAARSQQEARVLFGLGQSDFRWSGGELGGNGSQEAIAMVMAEPGQVFARWADAFSPHPRPWVRVVRDGTSRLLVPGDGWGLEQAEELLAGEQATREAKAQREVERVARRQDQDERAEALSRRAREALATLRPVLAEEGIHPDQLGESRHGIWVTPEVAETIAGLVVELQEVRGL